MFWKIFKGTAVVLTLLVTVLLLAFYAPDQSLEGLKDKWTYSNSRFIDVSGIPVHYRVNGEGTPLLLIHGTGASLHTWERWTELLEGDFKVISLDLPAYGLTGPNQDGTYSLDFYAKFIDQFVQQIGVDSMHVAGNSLGGAIALRYTTMFPEKVKKLVLIDASGYPSNKPAPLAFKLAKSEFWSKLLLHFTPKFLFKKSLEDVYFNDDLVTDKLINRYYELYLRPDNRQAFIDRINKQHPVDPQIIKTITVPTLIQWGQEDEWISVENSHLFHEDIKNSQLIIYEDAGHVPMEESPDKTARDCRIFLLKK